MKTLKNINPTTTIFNTMASIIILIFIVCNAYGNNSFLGNGDDNVPGRYNLPDHLRPAFENMPVWRLQLKVKTGGIKNAGTDDEVYVKMTNSSSSVFYLDKGGDDRERKKVNTYDIIDPKIRTVRDIKKLEMMIKGNDGWCVQSVEILINDVQIPVFTKRFRKCQWLDGNGHSGPKFYISGKEMRKNRGWKYTNKNRALWLPPKVLKREMLEAMVESYVGHMMNSRPDMKKLEFGKKYGRSYVEAKKKTGNKLKFDLDLAYKKGIDLEVDVDFDLAIKCQNNTISLNAENVKGKLNIPIVSKLVRVFKKDFTKRKFGNFNFDGSNVSFCPSIKVMNNGDIALRP
jgi:hypothetical protein